MFNKIASIFFLFAALVIISSFTMRNSIGNNYCAFCGSKIETGMDFCKNCNNSLKDDVHKGSWICPECKAKNFNRYCTKCGLDVKTGLLKSIIVDENVTSIALLEESSIYAAYDKKQKKILLIDAIKEEKLKEIPININVVQGQDKEIKEDIISIESITKDKRYASIVRNDSITELLDLDKNETKCSFRTEGFSNKKNSIFTKDSKKFIVALPDSTISILDIEQNTRIGLLQGNSPLAISNDGKYLACMKSDANSNYYVLIYDIIENRIIGKQDSVSSDIQCIQFSKDNQSIVIASSGGGDEFVRSQLDIANLNALDKSLTIFWKENGAYNYGTDLKSFSFSPSGNYLVSPGDFNTLIVFNYILRGDPKRLWGNDNGDIEAFSFLAENKIMCLAGKEIRIYRVDTVLQKDEKIKFKDLCTEVTERVRNLVKYSDKNFNSLCYYFFEGEGSGQYFSIWKKENNFLSYKHNFEGGLRIECLDLTGKTLAILQCIENESKIDDDYTYILFLINTDDRQIINKIMINRLFKGISIEGLLKNHQILINDYSGEEDKTNSFILNLKTGEIENSCKNKTALFWSENGRFILFSAQGKEGIEKTELFDSYAKEYFSLQANFGRSLLDNSFYNVFSPDSKYLVCSNSDTTLNLLSIENKKISKRINGKPPVCYSTDSKYILISTEKGFELYDTRNAEKKYSYRSNWGCATAFKFFRDGRYVLIGFSKGEIDLFKFGEKPILLNSFLGHYTDINSMDIAEDNNEFVSGSNDGTVIRWNLQK